MSGPYATGAPVYVAAGWPRPLPTLAAGRKGPPVPGYTGYVAGDVDDRTYVEWLIDRADANIVLRAPRDVVFVDRDTHKVPDGNRRWAVLEAALGPLPPAWRSSSRDGPSGKMPFRVPPGTRLRGDLAWNGVKLGEFLQWFHRYAVVWPSTNPDNDGAMERWWKPDGTLAEDEVPPYAELPDLPRSWLEHFADTAPPPAATRSERPARETVEQLERPAGLHPLVAEAIDRPKGPGGSKSHIAAVIATCKQVGYGRDQTIRVLRSDPVAIAYFESFDYDAGRWCDRSRLHPDEHPGALCSSRCPKLTNWKMRFEAVLAAEHLCDLVVPALGRNGGAMSLRALRSGPFQRFRRTDPYRYSAEWIERVVALGVERGLVDRLGWAGGGRGGRPSVLVRLYPETSGGPLETASDQHKRDALPSTLIRTTRRESFEPPNSPLQEAVYHNDVLTYVRAEEAAKANGSDNGPYSETRSCLNVRCDELGVVQSPVTGCWLCPTHAATFGYARGSAT